MRIHILDSTKAHIKLIIEAEKHQLSEEKIYSEESAEMIENLTVDSESFENMETEVEFEAHESMRESFEVNGKFEFPINLKILCSQPSEK